MATYKVIQDIEAEDKLLGPLTLRQFIYAIITVVCIYFSYLAVTKHVGFLAIIFLPPALFTGFLAWPWGRDQPTEVWAVAKVRFLFKPRKRIWDQSGVKNLVTVTAPKRVEEDRTDGLSQIEVKSRLEALANTIDSRGWAIKNVNLNTYQQPSPLAQTSSDRLIDLSSMPQAVPSYDVTAADDIMDAQNNPIAQQFDQMINASAQAHRQHIVNQLQQPTVPGATAQPSNLPADYWFLNQPTEVPQPRKNETIFSKAQVVVPGTDQDEAPEAHAADPTAAEEALAEKLKAQHDKPKASYAHMRTIQPIDPAHPTPQPATTPTVTAAPDPAKINLANRNDLNVATIARIANRQDEPPEDEVVISLH